MNLRLFQRYYAIFLFKIKKTNDYIDISNRSNIQFKNIKFILNEENIWNEIIP